MKQLGIALHNYHDSHKVFPPGVIIGADFFHGTRVNFNVHLLPYIEMGNLYKQIDFNVSLTIGGNSHVFIPSNQAVTSASVPMLLCPSDGGKTHIVNTGTGGHPLVTSPPQRTFCSNYFGVFSGNQWGESVTTNRSRMAMFGVNRSAPIRDVTDGVSNTMFMAEGLTGVPGDFRGSAFSDQAAGAQVYTELGPNSRLPDRCYPCCNWCDKQTTGGLPALNLPATQGDGFTTDTAASRSRHAGGVHILMGDGAVRFVSDSINLVLWRGLATMSGNEIVGDF